MSGSSGELEITAILASLGKRMNQPGPQNCPPLDAARALAGQSGVVFLDSAVPGTAGISILASRPEMVLSGNDWDGLEREIAKRSTGVGTAGMPSGAAMGWVAFDGSFQFGFFPESHITLGCATPGETPRAAGAAPMPAAGDAIAFEPLTGEAEFVSMVARAREYIAAGDIYQVCLAHAFEAEAQAGAAWPFFERLRTVSPAPYSAYLDLGGHRIASASPECFLKMSGRAVSTHPIKGTRPRRPDPGDDRRSSHDLLTSKKEIAELVMITDLERNDLGQVCEFGSVSVPSLLRLEQFEQVHHLVSTVEGRLRPEVSHVRALKACFPGGSISGAPKKRALEIIRELERGPRGIYTGAIGYFGYNGESQFSIAIRTAVFSGEKAMFHVGAGIVADSIPEMEWQETWDKAAGLLLAAGVQPPR